MARLPEPVADFLDGHRFIVAGVSRDGKQPANAIFRKLRDAGYQTYPVNPNADEVEGVRCFHDVGSVPGEIDGVVIATHPDVSPEIVRQSAQRGIPRVWFHRSFGDGSVSDDAVAECEEHGVACIVGGCPMMFCEPVDIAHRCFRWWFQRRGKVPS